jgi:hypothetical protein
MVLRGLTSKATDLVPLANDADAELKFDNKPIDAGKPPSFLSALLLISIRANPKSYLLDWVDLSIAQPKTR